jgi:hypothetical protein
MFKVPLSHKNIVYSFPPEFVPLPLHTVLKLQEGLCHFAGLDKVETQPMVSQRVQPSQGPGGVFEDGVQGESELKDELIGP